METILSIVQEIIQSKFSSVVILLIAAAGAGITLRQTVTRVRQEMRLSLLECKEDSLLDVKFNASLLAIASKYQAAAMGLTGGNRSEPAMLRELSEELRDLRRRMHDETNRRRARVEEARQRLQLKLTEREDDGL